MPRPATSTEPLESGMQIGRYELIRPLAVGGMAEIFLARAAGIEGFEKLLVIKRILPHLAGDPDYVAMFLDEARLAAALHHANIAQVYDIGNDGGNYFFAMEYVEGKDVRHIRMQLHRDKRELPLEHALGIVLGAASGLHAAHDKRGRDGQSLHIVHRDVSPSNVIVTFDGGVKVIDFGIAKAAERKTHTRTGVLKGKSAYMSPEQWTGEPVDRRSDVFALGILLFELTTGSRLFRKGAEYETMRQLMRGRSLLAGRLPAEYPAPLRHIVSRALESDPAARYPTAQELCVDIERFAREERLPVSSFGLASFLGELFPDDGPAAAAGEPVVVIEPDSGPVIHDAARIDRRYAAERAPTVLDVCFESGSFLSGEIDIEPTETTTAERALTAPTEATTRSTWVRVPPTRVIPRTRIVPGTRVIPRTRISKVAPAAHPARRWMTISVAAAAALAMAAGAWFATASDDRSERAAVAATAPVHKARKAQKVAVQPTVVAAPAATVAEPDDSARPAVEPERAVASEPTRARRTRPRRARAVKRKVTARTKPKIQAEIPVQSQPDTQVEEAAKSEGSAESEEVVEALEFAEPPEPPEAPVADEPAVDNEPPGSERVAEPEFTDLLEP